MFFCFRRRNDRYCFDERRNCDCDWKFSKTRISGCGEKKSYHSCTLPVAGYEMKCLKKQEVIHPKIIVLYLLYNYMCHLIHYVKKLKSIYRIVYQRYDNQFSFDHTKYIYTSHLISR